MSKIIDREIRYGDLFSILLDIDDRRFLGNVQVIHNSITKKNYEIIIKNKAELRNYFRSFEPTLRNVFLGSHEVFDKGDKESHLLYLAYGDLRKFLGINYINKTLRAKINFLVEK